MVAAVVAVGSLTSAPDGAGRITGRHGGRRTWAWNLWEATFAVVKVERAWVWEGEPERGMNVYVAGAEH